MGKKKVTFPEVLYVRQEEDNDGSQFLVPYKSKEDLDEEGQVGVYKLSRVSRVTITTEVD